jgi:hypothetical protein
MRLSRDAIEALILVGGFLFVVAMGALVMWIWPTHLHGNWRLFLALAIAALVAVPTALKLKARFAASEKTDKSS